MKHCDTEKRRGCDKWEPPEGRTDCDKQVADKEVKEKTLCIALLLSEEG